MPYVCFNIECSTDIPRGQVKRCARCRIATYCSKACQVTAWKNNHRASCILHEGLVPGPDGRLKEPDRSTDAGISFHIEKRLDRWLQHWRRVIYGFTPFAHDLANNPEHVQTHVMTIWVTPNLDLNRDKIRDFIITHARLVPVTELSRYMPNDESLKLSRAELGMHLWPDVVMFRTALIVNPADVAGRIMKHGFRDIQQWHDMDKATSALNSRIWPQILMEFTNQRNPVDAMETLKSGIIYHGDGMRYFC